LGQNDASGFAFADRAMFKKADTFRKVHFTHTDKQEEQAYDLAQEWMSKSPYSESLDSVTQFTAELRKQAFHINFLLQSEMGDSAYDMFGADRIAKKKLKPAEDSRQGALAIGSRIDLDPWSGKLAFIRSEQETQAKTQTLPFELTPINANLRRRAENNSEQLSAEYDSGIQINN